MIHLDLCMFISDSLYCIGDDCSSERINSFHCLLVENHVTGGRLHPVHRVPEGDHSLPAHLTEEGFQQDARCRLVPLLCCALCLLCASLIAPSARRVSPAAFCRTPTWTHPRLAMRRRAVRRSLLLLRRRLRSTPRIMRRTNDG